MRDLRSVRWLSLHGDGAIKSNDNVQAPPAPRRGLGQPRNERIAVSAISRVIIGDEPRAVRIVGLSASTAMVLSAESIGKVGECVDVFLPIVGDRELRVTAGIVSVDIARQGHAVTLHFMIADASLRGELNDLFALLLSDDGELARHQPRVIYDVPVRWGVRLERVGHLEELSPSELSMRVSERLPHYAPMRLMIPAFHGGPHLALEGTVKGQRLAPEGGYHTLVVIEELEDSRRRALSELIAQLMCR